MATIVTDKNCGACRALKKILGNSKEHRFVDIDSPEGQLLDKKFNIKSVPFATNGQDKCNLRWKKDKIEVNCNK